MNRSPPSQAASWKRSRHGRNRPAPVVLSICFRRLHLRIAAHGYGVSRPSMSCLPMTSTAARMSQPLDQRDGEQACLDADLRRAAGSALRSWHPVHGWRERIGGRRQGCIPACHGSALHRTPHPQFHPPHPKQWSAFTKQLKLIYGAINVKQARQEFEKFKTDWQAYPGAVSVWENNFSHVEQLYNYGSAVRKIMYTTNAIESVNSSVTKNFPNEDAVFHFLPRIQELYKNVSSPTKRNGRQDVQPNTMLLNESILDTRFSTKRGM